MSFSLTHFAGVVSPGDRIPERGEGRQEQRPFESFLPFALYRQGYEYYWKTHAHPNSTFKYTTSSLLDLMNFDVTDHINLINKPLLMIAGSKADTLYMTKDAFAKATGTKDKELFLIDGATHIETIGCLNTLTR